MSEEIRRTGFSYNASDEIYEEAAKELKGVEISVESEIGKEADVATVDEESPDTSLTSRFVEDVSESESVETGSEEIRKTGFKRESLSLDDNEGMERIDASDDIQKKHSQILELNESFRDRDISRRYVLSKADVPEGAIMFEDALSQYFYKIDSELSPQDCVDIVDKVDSWFETPEDKRPYVGVLALAKAYPWAVQDVVDSDVDTDVFLDNVFKREGDVAKKRDVHKEFSVEQFEEMCSIFDNR